MLDIRESSTHAFIDLNPAHSVLDGLAMRDNPPFRSDAGGVDFAQYFSQDRLALSSHASAHALATAQTAFSFSAADDAPEPAATADEAQNLLAVSAHAATKAATFNPNTFKITPGDLSAAVGQITTAITQGYAPAKAIALLETASAKVSVSFDDMLALTDTRLHTTAGARAAAALKAFSAEIKTRLTSDAAATALATLVHAGHLTASAAGTVILDEAKEATPTAALEEHAVAQLLAALLAKHVAAAQVRALAKQDSALIITGIERESAPAALDLSAGARAFESELTTYSASAAARVEKLFAGLDATAAQWATLNTIEAAGVKDAVTDKVLTQAKANLWTKALDTAQDAAAAKLVDPIALQLAAGTITDTTATQELKAMAPTQAKLDALMLAAALANPSDATANALGLLEVYASLDGALVDAAGLDKTLYRLVADVMSETSATGVDGLELSYILQRAFAFGGFTDAQVHADIVKASATDKTDGPDQWLLATANSLGGPLAAYNAGYVQPFAAIANAMAARIKSGAFLAGVINEYTSHKMALGSADAYIEAYAHLAMANDYSVTAENKLADPELTQSDGVTSDDRIGYELIKFIADTPAADTAAITKYAETNNTLDYITGLGFTAGMGNDRTVAADLLLANKIVVAGDMANVVAAGNSGGSGTVNGTPVTDANEAVYEAASSDAAAAAQAFANGLNSYQLDATIVLSGSSTNPYGSLLQNGKNIVTNPGSFSNFKNLAVTGLGAKIGGGVLDKEISWVQDGAEAANFILDKTGLGALLGPVGTGIESADNFINNSVGILDTAIDGWLAAPAVDMVYGVGKTLFDLAGGIGQFAADFFTGNFSAAGQDAAAIGAGIENDLGDIEDQVAADMISTAYTLANEIVDLGKQLAAGIEDIVDIFTSALDSAESAVDSVWSGIESIY